MSTSKILLAVVALTLALVAFQYWWSSDEPTLQATPDPENLPAATEERPEKVSAQESAVADIDDLLECLSADELRDHPVIRQYMSQIDAASVEGTEVEVFRGLDEATVRGYAEQGDSAAMAVMGALQVMRAYRIPDSQALDWLNRNGKIDGQKRPEPLPADASLALNDAAYWFYEAALNGRLMALQHYGQVRGTLFGGPVGLGWIVQEEYDALEGIQRDELFPVNMYRRVAIDLIPGSERIPLRSEIAERVRNEIHNEFNITLSDSGLTPPAMSVADSKLLEELRLRVCETE
jgi:hypothetical protein